MQSNNDFSHHDWHHEAQDVLKPIHNARLERLYASTFSSIAVIVLLVPGTLLYINLSAEISRLWFHNEALVLCLLPFFILAGHLIHIKKKKPSKTATVLGLFIPSAIVVAYSMSVAVSAEELRLALFSLDCGSHTVKRDMQHSWDTAANLLGTCYVETYHAMKGNVTLEALQTAFRIEDCEEYAEVYPMHKKNWDYFAMLERNHRCSGWCYWSVQVWAHGATQDSCSTVVAEYFRFGVEPQVTAVSCTALAVLVVALVGIIVLIPYMQNAKLI
mmetsp:Transcript_52997/g.141664  ORF Transcript_52997/g.141664 Transcript_52997/m.141664 type:complete len:273 (-) Transcript_52997:128-946(-)